MNRQARRFPLLKTQLLSCTDLSGHAHTPVCAHVRGASSHPYCGGKVGVVLVVDEARSGGHAQTPAWAHARGTSSTLAGNSRALLGRLAGHFPDPSQKQGPSLSYSPYHAALLLCVLCVEGGLPGDAGNRGGQECDTMWLKLHVVGCLATISDIVQLR
eukprot:scaffold155364_cov18-Tisochrysis_lutea.AAC.1